MELTLNMRECFHTPLTDFMYLLNLFYQQSVTLSFHQFILFQTVVTWNVNLSRHRCLNKYLPNIKNFCKKIEPFVDFYKKEIDYYNKTIHDILTKEIPLVFSNFVKNQKEKRGIIASLVTGFIRLVHEGISCNLNNKR